MEYVYHEKVVHISYEYISSMYNFFNDESCVIFFSNDDLCA
jgi:hypothetical protein